MGMTRMLHERWTAWIDQFNRDQRELNGSLVVIGSKGALHLVAEGLPFNGLAFDMKDGESTVVISLGQLDHTVVDVTELALEESDVPPAMVHVKSADGTTTILHLS